MNGSDTLSRVIHWMVFKNKQEETTLKIMELKKIFVLTTIAAVLGIAARTDAITVKVWPEKMQVRPNEEVKLTVTVTGLAAGEKAAVECRVVNRIDTEVARFKGETGENGKVTYIFKPGQEFGYEVQVVATKGQRTGQGFRGICLLSQSMDDGP